MSEMMRFTSDKSGYMLGQKDGGWVRYKDHLAEVERLKNNLFPWDTYDRLKNANEHLKEDVATLTAQRDAAQAEVERLQGDVERLRAERDQMATHPREREVGRYGFDGHYIDAMEPTRLTDEDIWREAFITMLPSFPWEKAAEQSDRVLAEYRKRWPR